MKINIDNININYKVYGENNDSSVVILHGWGSNLENFNSISNQLASKYKVYVIDLPGFGKSDLPKIAFTIMDYATITKNFMDELNIKNPILIGHSFGGRIIITLTGSLNFNANKIILINSAGIKPRRTLKYYIKTYTYKCLKYLICILPDDKKKKYLNKLRQFFGSKDYNEVPEIMKGTLSLVVNQDLKIYMPKIITPTLLIWGEKDTITPLKDGYKMKKLIPNSGLVILKDAGHYSYIDNYYEFIQVLFDFLEINISI